MPALCLCWLLMLATTSVWADEAAPERRAIEPKLLHLRSGVEREWSEFPETPHGQRLNVMFASTKNETEQMLVIRQQEVKQVWNVLLNGKKLGALTIDENDMVVTFVIPVGGLVEGDNSLRIESPSASKAASDDIRVGQITLVSRSVREALREATLEVNVVDADSKQPLPCRITVLDSNGAMQSLGAESNDHLAVRPGMAFTSTGHATLGVPAGRYTIFAGRGFEYSLARAEVTVGAGETVRKSLAIRCEVPTEGFVACDTHVHTLTHSGHGDATIEERMITLAGEGIELPIATDHNMHIDYDEVATKLGVRCYFTPVVGNEVTTPRGHFNIFPIAAGARVVDHKRTDWKLLFDDIQQTPGVKVAILNHARDLHSGVRPFGPQHFNAIVGENLDGWPLRFNAMEVVNSGATQTDPLRLFHDWMGLLNRGLNVTPVGSSDSHDVGRHFVGQGRTYIRCDDRDPGKLNVEEAVTNFVQGRVMVSYGLLTEITVNDKYHSGDMVAAGDDEVRIDVRVLGPHWTRASQVQLFANGHVIRVASIPETEQVSAVLPERRSDGLVGRHAGREVGRRDEAGGRNPVGRVRDGVRQEGAGRLRRGGADVARRGRRGVDGAARLHRRGDRARLPSVRDADRHGGDVDRGRGGERRDRGIGRIDLSPRRGRLLYLDLRNGHAGHRRRSEAAGFLSRIRPFHHQDARRRRNRGSRHRRRIGRAAVEVR